MQYLNLSTKNNLCDRTSETQLHGNDAPATIEAIEALASRALSQAQVAFDAARTQSNTMTNIQGKADEKVQLMVVPPCDCAGLTV